MLIYSNFFRKNLFVSQFLIIFWIINNRINFVNADNIPHNTNKKIIAVSLPSNQRYLSVALVSEVLFSVPMVKWSQSEFLDLH